MLGKGGFACVYRAKAIKTGLEVAIKMVSCLVSTHSYLQMSSVCTIFES